MAYDLRMVIPEPVNVLNWFFSNVPENDYPAWVVATVYAVGDRIIYVDIPNSIHWICECILAHTASNSSSIGNRPDYDIDANSGAGTNWLRVSHTNQWKAYDGKIGDQCSLAGDIVNWFQPSTNASTVFVFYTRAATAEVEVVKVADGSTSYSQSQSLIQTSGIIDWWGYFYTVNEYKNVVKFTGVPAYGADTLKVTVGGLAINKVGEIVFGIDLLIGKAILPLSSSINDFSTKEQDTFGNYFIKQRGFARKRDFKVLIPPADKDRIENLLARMIATPVIFYASDVPDGYGSVIYGIIVDYSCDIISKDAAYLSLTVNGLI